MTAEYFPMYRSASNCLLRGEQARAAKPTHLLPLPLQLGPQRTLRSRRVSGESAVRSLTRMDFRGLYLLVSHITLATQLSRRQRIFNPCGSYRPHEGWATSRHSLETRRPERKDAERGRKRHHASQAERRNFRRGAGEEAALDA